MYKLTTNEAEEQAPEITQSLDELAREGARRMILAPLELEVDITCGHCAICEMNKDTPWGFVMGRLASERFTWVPAA